MNNTDIAAPVSSSAPQKRWVKSMAVMSDIRTNFRVDGSMKDIVGFEAFVKDHEGIKAEHQGTRLNSATAIVPPDWVAITGSVAAIIAALTAYRKATTKKVRFHENGKVHEAENYSAEELAKILNHAESMEIVDDLPDKVIEGFAYKPKSPDVRG